MLFLWLKVIFKGKNNFSLDSMMVLFKRTIILWNNTLVIFILIKYSLKYWSLIIINNKMIAYKKINLLKIKNFQNV